MKNTSISAIAVVVLLVGGCATSPSQVLWGHPPGVFDQQFRKDDYTCIQESQQQSSSAYVGAYGGAAQSGSTSNFTLYKACMLARGYRALQER